MAATYPRDNTAAAFAELVRRRDEELPLDRAALLIARGITYPDLDLEPPLLRLDELATGLRTHLPRERDPRAIVAAMRDYLGGELGFAGPDPRREDDYADPRNSFLNDVLGRRIGLPIALSLVYLEVARRLDLPLVGVGMPLHFLVKYQVGGRLEDDLYLDPFFGGVLVTPSQLRERFAAQTRGRAPFAEHYLGAVTRKQILTRVLQNLKQVYVGRNDPRRALATLEYLLLIAPWDLESRRDRGLLSLRIGDSRQALEDLQAYEEFAAGDPNLPVIRGYIEALRRRFTLEG